MPLVVNCASACANQTLGFAGQSGGNYFTLMAAVRVGVGTLSVNIAFGLMSRIIYVTQRVESSFYLLVTAESVSTCMAQRSRQNDTIKSKSKSTLKC